MSRPPARSTDFANVFVIALFLLAPLYFVMWFVLGVLGFLSDAFPGFTTFYNVILPWLGVPLAGLIARTVARARARNRERVAQHTATEDSPT